MHEDILSRVCVVVERFFHLKFGTVKKEMSSIDIDRWDSLNNTLLVLDLEKEFNIFIDGRAIRKANSIGDIAEIISIIKRSSSL